MPTAPVPVPVPAAAPLAPAAAPDSALQPAAPRPGEPFTLNFVNAEIEGVARAIASITNRNVVVDPRVKGQITLTSEQPVNRAQALNQFLAALRLQGFTMVESGGLYKIVPEADAKLQGGDVVLSSRAAGNGSQIVTQIFKLNHENAGNLVPVLRPLISPNNTINVNPGNNSLVITDYADNLQRLAKIISAMDVSNATDVEVIPLQHSVASDLAPLVARLVEGGGSNAGGVPGAAPGQPAQADTAFRTTLIAEPRSNALIVRAANPARLALVRSLVARLDRPAAGGSGDGAGNIHVIYLKNADATRLAVTLRAALAATSPNAAAGGGGSAAPTPVTQASGSGFATTATNAGSNSASGSNGSSPQAGSPLGGASANQPSTGGQIQADPSTNALIITAPEPQMRQLRAVIDKLDGRRAQVLVESLIVEVNASKAAEFGVQWQTAFGNPGESAVGVLGTNSNLNGQRNILELAVAAAAGTADARRNALAAAQPSTGLNFGLFPRINGNYYLGVLARFLQSNGDANVLSTPNLLTLDNEEARIVIGQNVPFVTGQFTGAGGGGGTVNPFQTVERKDVGLTLRVRPQINENGTVKMAIFQEVSSVQDGTARDLNGPTTNKRSIESNVLVDDGAIVVLGGLLSDDYSQQQEKVPLLGDLPLVGNLFKSEIRNRQKTNLMVFLRPVVVRDSLQSDALTIDRYEVIRALQQGSQPASSAPLNAVPNAPVLPPIEQIAPASTTPRVQGTRLIPPPLVDTRPALAAEPLRGALPPTADPASQRRTP